MLRDPDTGKRTVKSPRYGRGSRWLAVWDEPGGQRRKKAFDNKGAAEEHLAAVADDVRTGSYITKARETTLAEAAELWKAAHEDWADSTRSRNVSILDKHVLPRWGQWPVAQIRREDVQAWVNGLPGPVNTRKRIHQVLSGILTWCVENDRLARNPALRLRFKKATGKATKKRHALPIVDADELVAAHSEHWQPWATTLAYTGLRVSEQAAMRVRWIDRKRRLLRVEGAMVVVDGRKREQDWSKTDASTGRSVPLVAPAWEAIEPLLAGKGPDDFVFLGPRGATVNRANYSRREFRSAAVAIGRPELEPHDLRHTAVSNAIAFGLSAKQVQAISGHKHFSTTMDVYGHLFPEDWDAARTKLDRGIAKARRRAAKRRKATAEPPQSPQGESPAA